MKSYIILPFLFSLIFVTYSANAQELQQPNELSPTEIEKQAATNNQVFLENSTTEMEIIKKACPHFVFMKNTGNKEADEAEYHKAKKEWLEKYPEELKQYQIALDNYFSGLKNNTKNKE